MAQIITEELFPDDGERRFYHGPLSRMVGGIRGGCVVEAGRYFSFQLHRKQAMFGDVPVDQFWMPLRSIYGGRTGATRNFKPLVRYFWSACKRGNTAHDPEVIDSFILANLLPYARRNGSRRIFDDAVLSRRNRSTAKRAQLVRQLDSQLAQQRERMLGLSDFHIRTADLLGPPEFPEEALREYSALTDELLQPARQVESCLGIEAGLQTAIGKLQSWMKGFVRRSGNETKKLALDMLSYECRSAVHRCYSAVWYDLLTQLQRKYQLDEFSVQYHRLMHFDIQFDSQRSDANFHLFHGHIFALHPGLGLFFQTRTGGELIADYLLHDGGKPLARMLNGFYLALVDYYLRSEECAEDRKKANRPRQVDDIEIAHQQQLESDRRRYGRTPKKSSDSDNS